MHAEKASVHLLTNNGSLNAVVPAVNVYPGIVPQDVALPALGVSLVDSIELPTIDAAAYDLKQSRISVLIHASSYASKKSIGALVRSALRYQRGTFNGVTVHSIVGAGDGPDDDNDDIPIYRQALDFLVTFTES